MNTTNANNANNANNSNNSNNPNNPNNPNNLNPNNAIKFEEELLKRINRLPFEMMDTIRSYIRPIVFAFTSKTNYVRSRPLIKPVITKAKKFENYVRDMVRRDNAFVFDYILKENCLKWFQDYTSYVYKNITYKNYIYFLLDFCIEHESTKCRAKIYSHLEELGLFKKST